MLKVTMHWYWFQMLTMRLTSSLPVSIWKELSSPSQ